MPDLTAIEHTLQALFTADADRLARATGLVRRRSKLTGPLLLLILVAGFIQHPTASYNILAQVAEEYGVSVTRQAIEARLTCAAVAFFKALFQRSLALLQPDARLPIPLLLQFTAVHLLDSTQVGLPDTLAAPYPGTGGDGPQASLKWQVLWDLLAGQLRSALDQPGKASDYRYRDYLAELAAGSLLLCDLGYVALAVLQQLVAAQVYFICRWNPSFPAFTAAGQPLDLLAELERQGRDAVELAMRVGVRAQLPLRLVACRVPPAAQEQRRRRAHATEQKRGVQYSAAYLRLLDWNIYLTNVTETQMTGEQVRLVYGARWQIELLFKLWKSEGELAAVRGRQTGRVMCEQYAKLIGMAVFMYLSAPVRLAERELSLTQAAQVWRRQIEKVGRALRKGSGLAGVLGELYARWHRYCGKEHRGNRPSTLQQLQEARPPTPERGPTSQPVGATAA